MNHPEVGRELKADELKAKTIVVIRAEHRPDIAVTMWVKEVGDSIVWLYAGSGNVHRHLGLFRQLDGTLRDDAGRMIHVYEYLGKP